MSATPEPAQSTCPRCKGTGWLCAANGGPADFEKGMCCKPDDEEFALAGGGCPSADGCDGCNTTGTSGGTAYINVPRGDRS